MAQPSILPQFGEQIRATPPVPPGLLHTMSPGFGGSSFIPENGSAELFEGNLPGLGISHRNEQASTAPESNEPSHYKLQERSILQADSGKDKVVDQEPAKPSVLDEEAFPALPVSSSSTTVKRPTKQAASISSTSSKDSRAIQSRVSKGRRTDTKTSIDPDKPKPAESPAKRQPFGKLDITAAKLDGMSAGSPPSTKPHESSHATTTSQPAEDSSAPASETSRSGTPSQTAEVSGRRTMQPKTIRVVPTPKTETSQVIPHAPVTVPSPRSTSAIGKRPSRQASIASSSNAPGTPISEKVSDVVSTTDAASRTQSPQPGKSSPATTPITTKSKTKSQVKKEKLEKAKAEEKKVETVTPSENVVHEPIVGRKKKTKKPGAPIHGTVTSTPTISRPASPIIEDGNIEDPAREESEQEDSRPQSPTLSKDFSIDDILTGLNLDGSNNRLENSSLFRVPITEGNDSFAEARTAHFNADAFSHPHAHLVHPLTPTEHAILDAGKPVRRGSLNGPHILISPSRFTVLFDATAEDESRYLELEKRLLDSPEHLRYNHRWAGEEASSMLRVFGLQAMALTEMAAMIMRPPTTVMAAVGADKAASVEMHGGWKSKAYAYAQDVVPADENDSREPEVINRADKLEASRSGSDSDGDEDEDEDEDEDDGVGKTNKGQQKTQSASSPELQSQPPQQQAYASDALAYLDQFILPLPTQPVTGPFAYGAAHGVNGLFPTTTANSTIGNFPPNHVSNLHTNHVANNTGNTISTPIPRLYTTGDPTYSVSAVDFNTTSLPSRERPYEGLSSRYYHPAANVGGQKFQGKNVNVTEQGEECRGIEEAIAAAKWDYERLTKGMRELTEKNKTLIGLSKGGGEVEVR